MINTFSCDGSADLQALGAQRNVIGCNAQEHHYDLGEEKIIKRISGTVKMEGSGYQEAIISVGDWHSMKEVYRFSYKPGQYTKFDTGILEDIYGNPIRGRVFRIRNALNWIDYEMQYSAGEVYLVK